MKWVEIARGLGYATTLLSACFLVQLFRLKLAGRYKLFAAYLITDILEGVLVFGVPEYSRWYLSVYLAGEAAKTILAVLFGVLLWGVALRGYPALGRAGKRVAYYVSLVSLALAALMAAVLTPARSAFQDSLIHYFNALQGAADSALLLFLIATTVFLLWFPVEVPRNVAAFIGGFVFYALQQWSFLLLVNLYPRRSTFVSIAALLLEAACLIFWLAAVKRNGEAITTVTGHRWNKQEADKLLSQLEDINKRLSEVGEEAIYK